MLQYFKKNLNKKPALILTNLYNPMPKH